MSTLKESIFREVRIHHAKSADFTDDQLNHLIFHHDSGLRLTYSGFLILKNIFTVYSFEMDDDLKSKHHMGMEKMEYPYYMTSRRLILFSEMDSMVIKLHGGIKGFLENCFRVGRDNE